MNRFRYSDCTSFRHELHLALRARKRGWFWQSASSAQPVEEDIQFLWTMMTKTWHLRFLSFKYLVTSCFVNVKSVAGPGLPVLLFSPQHGYSFNGLMYMQHLSHCSFEDNHCALFSRFCSRSQYETRLW